MKETPIILQAEMIKAVLDGRKSQTRRAIKPQDNLYDMVIAYQAGDKSWIFWSSDGPDLKKQTKLRYPSGGFKCPYGRPGDRLWIRECFGVLTVWGIRKIKYRADNSKLPLKWKPSIHMPRQASRLTLEIINIRAERVQDISEEDAIAEGCLTCCANPLCHCETPYRHGFQKLWDSINKKPKPKKKGGIITHYESFPRNESSRDPRTKINGKPHFCYPNPWVWALTFKEVKE